MPRDVRGSEAADSAPTSRVSFACVLSEVDAITEACASSSQRPSRSIRRAPAGLEWSVVARGPSARWMAEHRLSPPARDRPPLLWSSHGIDWSPAVVRAFMTDPRQLASLEGRQYLVLRPAAG